MRAARPTLLTLLTCLALWACGEALATPRAPATSAGLQQASDTTALLTATWPEVDPPADVYRWSLSEDGASGETENTDMSAEIERRDTTYAETVCVRGVAIRGSEVAEGEEGCASVDVPPEPLTAPGTPEVDAGVDTTTETAAVPDMPASVAVAEVGRTDTTVTYRASWECSPRADSYVVTAGSNSGRWSYTDTIPASACESETAMREAVLAFRERAEAHRECVAAGLCR